MQRKEKMMIKRLKKKGRQAIAFMLSLLTIISTVAASSTTAFAADGTLYFNSGETIPYGSYFTTRMTSDGNNTAYCLEPSKKTPEIGSYQYTLLSQNSSIRKALYYLNGGYGYEKVTKSQCFSGWPDTDSYVIGHLALAYIYDGYNDSGDAFLGAPSSFVTKTKETSVYKGYKQDKIEMRGDRAEMSDFPLYLNTVAGGLDRRDQTIGGFSFVVKIYAVPVVEIIG